MEFVPRGAQTCDLFQRAAPQGSPSLSHYCVRSGVRAVLEDRDGKSGVHEVHRGLDPHWAGPNHADSLASRSRHPTHRQ
jgi:hypothetical protein